MKVAFFYEANINPLKGGSERVTWSLSKYLISQGIQVYFIAHKKYHESTQEMASIQYYLPDEKGYDSAENISYLNSFIEENNIDILVNQGALSDELFLCDKRILTNRVKVVSVVHYDILGGLKYFNEVVSFRGIRSKGLKRIKTWLNLIRRPWLKRKCLKNTSRHFDRMVESSDAIVLLSESLKSDFLSLTNNKGADILVSIPNPNTYDNVNDSCSKEKMVLYVGRLCFSPKRVDRLLKIWQRVETDYPEWRLCIVGTGEEKAHLERLANRLKLSRVFFEGHQNPLSYYQKASIVCMTSTFEGFGMVLTEAMQHMAVPIAFKSYSSVTDIIENDINGYLINPFDIQEYADKLSSLMRNADLRIKMGEAAKLKTYQFTVEEVGSKWMNLFRSL